MRIGIETLSQQNCHCEGTRMREVALSFEWHTYLSHLLTK